MKIYLNIEADTPAEMFQAIQGLVANGVNVASLSMNESKPDTVAQSETTKTTRKGKGTTQEQTTTPAVETPSVETPATSSDDVAPTAEDKKVITIEEVRDKLAKLSQNGKQQEVKALIQKYGAAKLTEIPADKYAEVLADAEQIA